MPLIEFSRRVGPPQVLCQSTELSFYRDESKRLRKVLGKLASRAKDELDEATGNGKADKKPWLAEDAALYARTEEVLSAYLNAQVPMAKRAPSSSWRRRTDELSHNTRSCQDGRTHYEAVKLLVNVAHFKGRIDDGQHALIVERTAADDAACEQQLELLRAQLGARSLQQQRCASVEGQLPCTSF